MSCHALPCFRENSTLDLEALPHCDANRTCKLHTFKGAYAFVMELQGFHTVQDSNISPDVYITLPCHFTFVSVHAFDNSILHHQSGSGTNTGCCTCLSGHR